MTENRREELRNIVEGKEFRSEEYQKLKMEEAYYIHTLFVDATDDIGQVKCEFFRQLTVDLLKNLPEFYSFFLAGYQVPYVVCNQDTFDDEVLICTNEETARAELSVAHENNIPVTVIKCDNKHYLQFFSTLVNQGVNALRIKNGVADEEIFLMLDKICKKTNDDDVENKALAVSNPSLSLTMTYFIEELQKPDSEEKAEKIGELKEEMLANVLRAKFLVPLLPDEEGHPKKRIAFLQDKDGDIFLPLFTDAGEYVKSPQQQDNQVAIMTADEIERLLSEDVKGAAVNPFGANVRFASANLKQVIQSAHQ